MTNEQEENTTPLKSEEVKENTETKGEGEAKEYSESEKQLYARAKKAEAKLEELKGLVEEKPNKEETPTKAATENLTREEAKFYAQGGTDEELERLQKIMKGNGCSLEEAKNDDMYNAWKTQVEANKRSENAQVSASTRAGVSSDSGKKMTRAEHEAHAREIISKL